MAKTVVSKASSGTAQTKTETGLHRGHGQVNTLLVFLILSASHILAALYAPIQDCDEVFNYWEPTHYLTHGEGLQTWEYAPRFAIRSWAYAGLHATVIAAARLGLPLSSKEVLFYLLRLTLGAVCAACETRFVVTISKVLHERVGMLFVMIAVASPGLYHASVAYLPSSFAMYAAMLGASAFMDWAHGLKTAQGIVWFALGACIGWPFAVALSLPYLLEEAILACLSDAKGIMQLVKRVAIGTSLSLALLTAQVDIDAVFYRKLTIVPLNIVLYNVFSSKGPDLYGTEPWHFYLRNLALNFHLWLPLALSALPLLVIQMALDRSWTNRARGLVFLTPFYLWLAIFTFQPHKEERFMYPAYPFLVLNAAYTMNAGLAFLGNTVRGSLASRIPVMLRLSAILAFVALTFIVTALRVAGTWTAFSAPLSVYEPLASNSLGGNVCLGKEWYRFPSHYLLPDGYHARFIRSEFHGLLPGEFGPSNGSISQWYAGASIEPPGMNDENLEDVGKYVDLLECDFLVDSQLPSTVPTLLEPSYIKDKSWEALKCAPFLDAASTPILPRLFWTPSIEILPRSLRRVYGQYCLLRRRDSSTSIP